MKDTSIKLAFIKARAEGKSYSTIQEELGIAKATCASWEKSFKGDIEALKKAQIEELYTTYNMGREARIKAIGDILKGIDRAIASKDLENLGLDKLLELRLKYYRELKAEYTEPIEVVTDDTLDSLLEQYNQLYEESRAGRCTPSEVKIQLSILDAKRATLIQAEQEHQKEQPPILDIGIPTKSGIVRHDKKQQARL